MPHHRNPRSLLTPAMHSVLDRMARAGKLPLHALTPAQARLAYEVGAHVLEIPPVKVHRVETFTLPARDGFEVPVRLYAPPRSDHALLPVLVFFHGGGFVVGSIATHDSLCRTLSHLAHCAVLSVGYRLAPEHPFPVAFDDAWDAVRWVHQQGFAHGLDSSRIAVGGDSAGGTLAAACALQARDAGIPLALQMLIYPGCAARQDSHSHKTFGHGFLLEAAHIDYFFKLFLRSEADRDDARFAPLLADDLEGLAPAWFCLAECDPLVDEGLAYADKLRAAGVPVDLELYRGVVHEFIKMGRAIPESRQAHLDAAWALRQALG
ncbi:alpha/beta hydrolase [Rhodoferax sp. U2-2l]|uniref:alpha/beta hydrolase n=1 Tax=Rhodoferax sp. U2-2l TaxID=2884000 RepID=UPI001D0B364F|nr:alpha/beta hydrolase [Rhodoferax sp. U2-2l]MCB8747817.1 alpha/beta hydrolase [Rhodoferax sp. U2-2l]